MQIGGVGGIGDTDGRATDELHAVVGGTDDASLTLNDRSSEKSQNQGHGGAGPGSVLGRF